MDILATAKKVLRSDFCPKCEVKKLINKGRVHQTALRGYDNGTSLTPPMGWSSWNLFANHINEQLIMEMADAMQKSGLAEYGYRYINIDDCWEASSRTRDGKLQCDPITFPSGIKALAEYVNERGLKLGIYSSNGTRTCENFPASLGHEAVDADTFAEWGVEYFKYDFCNNVPIPADAPKIYSMSVGVAGKGDFALYTAEQASLTGNARVMYEEGEKKRPYITGLCSRNGTAVFGNVEIEEDGEYVLTFTVKTGKFKPEFAFVKIGDVDYRLECAPTKAFSSEKREQVSVKLMKGANRIEIYNPVGSVMDSAAIQYKGMGEELKRATREHAEKNGTAEKPIVFSICEWGRNKPWKWGRQAGNLWRTTPDIAANWLSVRGIYEVNVRLYKHAAIGGWNDPDMLEVGNGNLTHEENRSHFSLWCMMCAPLILGNDLRKFIKPDGTADTQNRVYQILTNRDMIAINQDALGKQCRRFKRAIAYDILIKPLENRRAAVCLFNKSGKVADIGVELKDIANDGYLDLPVSNAYTAFDVWDKTVQTNCTSLSATVAPHGVKVFTISAE